MDCSVERWFYLTGMAAQLCTHSYDDRMPAALQKLSA